MLGLLLSYFVDVETEALIGKIMYLRTLGKQIAVLGFPHLEIYKSTFRVSLLSTLLGCTC